MGEEVSDYIGRLVPAMQAAYGAAWNIAARGESPKIDDRAWQVQVGYSDFQPRRNGALGLQMTMTCAATISYVGQGVDSQFGPPGGRYCGDPGGLDRWISRLRVC